MKKRLIIMLLCMTVFISGCTLLETGNHIGSLDAMKALGIAYSEGEYTMEYAFCSGFVTSTQTVVWLAFPVAKRFLDGQTVTVTSVNQTELRANGDYLTEIHADLTPFIKSTQISNGGALILVKLENTNKWTNDNKKSIPNNTTIVGNATISFIVSDPV